MNVKTKIWTQAYYGKVGWKSHVIYQNKGDITDNLGKSQPTQYAR